MCLSFGTMLSNTVSLHSKTLLHMHPFLRFQILLAFTMCTGASALGIGAVLMQTEEGKRPHAIAYASPVLTSAV